MPSNDKSIADAAREARNRYYREYRAKNREKMKAIRQRYWEKKALMEGEKTNESE